VKWLRPKGQGALLRGEDWCISLTSSEVKDLNNQADKLQQLLQESTTYLMPEEDLEIACETDTISLYLTGDPTQFSLTIRLHQFRIFEGEWPTSAGPSVLAELQTKGIPPSC